jgi:Domain of unknown function (DUF4928)
MKQIYPVSAEEERGVEALGGIDRAAALADQVLAKHGLLRGLFTKRERDLIRLGRRPQKQRIEFHFNPGKSLRANINDLLDQASELQATSGGTNYVGAMLQHLVGAKLDIVLGPGKLHHYGFSVADQSTDRQSDFQIESIAIHVTTHPSEALIAKSSENLRAGLKPLIITLGPGVEGAAFLLSNSNLEDRVDVLDIGQFLTANVYERSLFKTAACKVTLSNLLERYNEIVASCESDPALRIAIKLDAR